MDKKYLISFLALIVITTCIIPFIFYVIFNLKPIDESLIQLNVYKKITVFATKQQPQLTTKGLPKIQNKTDQEEAKPEIRNKKHHEKVESHLPWSEVGDRINQCFLIYNDSFLKIVKTGVFTVNFKFQISATLHLQSFEVKVYLKRDNKPLSLGSILKRTKGPTKIWFTLTNINVHTNDLLYVLTKPAMYINLYTIDFSGKCKKFFKNKKKKQIKKTEMVL